MVIGIAVYLLVWYVLVQVFKIMAPQSDKEWEEYSEEHGIPHMDIKDMIVGIAALWVFWLALGILWIAYWLIKKIVTFVFDLVR
jgi:hypothetical protein